MSSLSREKSRVNNCLVDWFRPGESDGPLLGAVLSTYGLSLDQPDFFGQDFLPTLLGLGGVRDRGYSSPVTLDRSLAATDVVLICDPHALAAGVRPTLRVDLLPLGPRRAVQSERRIHHSKIQLIHRQNLIRLVIASANLTHDGFRKQREAAVILDFHEHGALPSSILTTALERWAAVLGDFAHGRVRQIFDGAAQQALKWNGACSGQNDIHIEVVFGGGQTPIWSHFVNAWPAGESVLNWSICSPFWPPHTSRRAVNPFEAIVDGLLSKKCVLSECELGIVARADSPTENALPRFPFKLLRHLRASKSFPIRKGRIFPAQLTPAEDEIPSGMAAENRDLHAKWMVMTGPKTALAIIGSANFTCHGMGTIRDPADANIEACVLMRWPRDKWRPESWRPPIQGRIVDWQECAEADLREPIKEKEPPTDWPVFVRAIHFAIHWERSPDPDGDLSVILLSDEETHAFNISVPDSSSVTKIGPPTREKRGRSPNVVQIHVEPDDVRRLLTRRVVRISWGNGLSALFPINISQDSKIEMPSILGAKPSEEQLLAYFHGRISEEDLLARLTEQARVPLGPRALLPEENERHKQMQNYIVREFVESLFGLINTIRESGRSPKAAEQAMMGDFSPVNLGEQVVQAFMSGRRSATATAFQMVELIAVVAGVKWPDKNLRSGSDRASYEQIRKRTLNRLYGMLSHVAARDALRTVLQNNDFQRYALSTLPSSFAGRWRSLVKKLKLQGQRR